MMKSIRRRTYEVLETAAPGDTASRWCDLAIMSLIVLNVIAIVLESVASINEAVGPWFWRFEVFSVVIFTVEYLGRVWSAVESRRFGAGWRGRFRFMVSPMAIIDLLAVLPFFLVITGVDLRMLRVLRIFRLLRLAKFGRYSRAMQLLNDAFHLKREEIVITLSMLFALLLISAALMYYAEHEMQPEVFSSIPASAWWAVATLTTVGYGDTYPITAIGRVLGGLIAITGIGMVALPTAILGGAFVEVIGEQKRCPHCDKPLGASARHTADEDE